GAGECHHLVQKHLCFHHTYSFPYGKRSGYGLKLPRPYSIRNRVRPPYRLPPLGPSDTTGHLPPERSIKANAICSKSDQPMILGAGDAELVATRDYRQPNVESCAVRRGILPGLHRKVPLIREPWVCAPYR